jgi:trans-aconitate 3-methyltransferase
LLTDRKYLVFSDDWYPESKHPGAEVRELIMSKTATFEGLEAYLRTWSSVHAYLEKFPDVAAARGKGAEGDVVDRIITELKGMLKAEGVPEDGTFTQDTAMVLLLHRKPAA